MFQSLNLLLNIKTMIYDNPAYVTAEKLAFVMNYSTLQTLCKRNRAIRVRRACRGVVALYDIRALPERWRIKVYEAFPETCPTRSVCLLMDGLQSSEDAKLWFFDYTLPTGKHLSRHHLNNIPRRRFQNSL